MITSGLLLVSLGLGYLIVSAARHVLRTRRRAVTLADTLLANVLQNIGQH
jgi:hypothetical protein